MTNALLLNILIPPFQVCGLIKFFLEPRLASGPCEENIGDAILLAINGDSHARILGGHMPSSKKSESCCQFLQEISVTVHNYLDTVKG
jgi:hypothetical protein